MSKMLTIAWREFIETVRTRTFIFTSIFMPMLMLGLIFGSEWIADVAGRQEDPPREIALLDETGQAAAAFGERIAAWNTENPGQQFALKPVESDGQDADRQAREDEAKQQVLDGSLYAFISIPAQVTDPASEVVCRMIRKDSGIEQYRALQRMIQHSVEAARFATANPPLDRQRIERLQQDVPLLEIDAASDEVAGDRMARFMTPFAFMFMLFLATLNISQGLLTSVIEEKSSRVVEVLLSAVSPTQLMAGKILGMVMVGALLLVVWSGVGYFGAEARNMSQVVTPFRVTYMALYFVPGFLLMSALLAGVGSACNTLKDAQSMAFPLTLLTIFPMMLWWVISMRPQSTLSVALSFIPPITPFVMILRICADPDTPMWQIVATQALLWASVVVAIWAAGRVFRIGVLMYGKPPTPRELLRWIRVA